MTIKFNCPNCNALIAFADKHRGKRARCTSCGERFVIPSGDNETPQKSEPPKEKPEPLPGFYRAIFIESWKLFIRAQNLTGLVFVVAAVCFKFFTGHTDYSFTMGAFRVQAPLGLIVILASWGCLFWYYMEIICLTASDADELPDVYMGGLFGFIWKVIKSLSVFAVAMVTVLLPCIILIATTKKTGVVSHILALIGLFAFPMAILTISVSRDIVMVFRLDYIIKTIAKAFWPYLVVFGLFVLSWELQLRTVAYGQLLARDRLIIGLHLLVNLAVQAIAIIAMRSIGLFYRHYSCHFPW
ncbi:MAG: zinc ribbon domain-containing protein [Planctomycetota bacterium]|jgi:hypothetical protein